MVKTLWRLLLVGQPEIPAIGSRAPLWWWLPAWRWTPALQAVVANLAAGCIEASDQLFAENCLTVNAGPCSGPRLND
jgi:hypothetical protein